jgi:recombination protein RecA
MKAMGIDVDKLVIVQGYTGEENLDLTKTLMATGNFDVIVVDSISALQPAAEANLESFDKQTMGLHPRLMSRMCRDLTPIAARTNTALLLINQIRSNISGYGNPETTAGGNALRHYYTGRVRVTGGSVKSRQITNSKGDVVGHRVTFEITKNKLAPPFRKADTDLIYGTGFHLEGELLDLGVDMGFIDQAGAWFSYEGDKLGQGREKAVRAITESEDIKAKLLHDVKVVLGFGGKDEQTVQSGDSDAS